MTEFVYKIAGVDAAARLAQFSPKSPIGDSIAIMRRATITIPDDLARAVDDYVREQEARPPLTAIIQAALRQYLTDRGFMKSSRPLRITPAKQGSGKRDVSDRHDSYLSRR